MLVWVPEPVCQTDQRELVVELAVDHLLGGRDDRPADVRFELAERHVRLGGGALDDAERADHRQRHALPPIRKFCSERWVCAPQ